MPPLLVTDQERCYGPDGREKNCAGSGQDAACPKSVLPAAERFEKRDGLIFDRLTGACWAAGSKAAAFPLNWTEARDFVRDMARDKDFGRDGWQLPDRRLFFSLISHQQTRPALPLDHPFGDIFSGPCWTKDSVSRLPEQAWLCHIGDGRLIKANKRDEALVWAVCPPENEKSWRDEASYKEPIEDGAKKKGNAAQNLTPENRERDEEGAARTNAPESERAAGYMQERAGRFLAEGQCVRDSFSGLVWPREAGLFPGPLDWQSALDAVAGLNARAWLGREDWRLPNIRELESLADLSAHTPALTPGHPFTGLREGYWSSTTSVYEPRYAWALYMRDGFVGVGFKPDAEFSFLPVADQKI